MHHYRSRVSGVAAAPDNNSAKGGPKSTYQPNRSSGTQDFTSLGTSSRYAFVAAVKGPPPGPSTSGYNSSTYSNYGYAPSDQRAVYAETGSSSIPRFVPSTEYRYADSTSDWNPEFPSGYRESNVASKRSPSPDYPRLERLPEKWPQKKSSEVQGSGIFGLRPLSRKKSPRQTFLLGQNIPIDPEVKYQRESKRRQEEWLKQQQLEQIEDNKKRKEAEKERIRREDEMFERNAEKDRQADLRRVAEERQRAEEKARQGRFTRAPVTITDQTGDRNKNSAALYQEELKAQMTENLLKKKLEKEKEEEAERRQEAAIKAYMEETARREQNDVGKSNFKANYKEKAVVQQAPEQRRISPYSRRQEEEAENAKTKKQSSIRENFQRHREMEQEERAAYRRRQEEEERAAYRRRQQEEAEKPKKKNMSYIRERFQRQREKEQEEEAARKRQRKIMEEELAGFEKRAREMKQARLIAYRKWQQEEEAKKAQKSLDKRQAFYRNGREKQRELVQERAAYKQLRPDSRERRETRLRSQKVDNKFENLKGPSKEKIEPPRTIKQRSMQTIAASIPVKPTLPAKQPEWGIQQPKTQFVKMSERDPNYKLKLQKREEMAEKAAEIRRLRVQRELMKNRKIAQPLNGQQQQTKGGEQFQREPGPGTNKPVNKIYADEPKFRQPEKEEHVSTETRKLERHQIQPDLHKVQKRVCFGPTGHPTRIPIPVDLNMELRRSYEQKESTQPIREQPRYCRVYQEETEKPRITQHKNQLVQAVCNVNSRNTQTYSPEKDWKSTGTQTRTSSAGSKSASGRNRLNVNTFWNQPIPARPESKEYEIISREELIRYLNTKDEFPILEEEISKFDLAPIYNYNCF